MKKSPKTIDLFLVVANKLRRARKRNAELRKLIGISRENWRLAWRDLGRAKQENADLRIRQKYMWLGIWVGAGVILVETLALVFAHGL